MTRRGFARATPILLALLALLPGCGGLGKPYPVKKDYVFDVSRPAAAGPTDSEAILLIRRFRTAPPFENQGFAYRTGDLEYESDFYNVFFSPPAALLTDQTRQWLAASRVVRLVIGPGVNTEATHSLEGRLYALYGDYRRPDDPRAVLGIQFFVSRLTDTPEVVFHKDYRQEVRVNGRTPAALVAAWNEDLRQILTSLEADLRTGPFKPAP
jgi:cholesterol transport system auxiliary component